MATHDYVISNASGAAVRADLNNALAAIVSNNSSATAPTTTYAYQWWADTTAGVLKIRNSANSAWITLFQLDGEFTAIPLENGTAAAPSLYFKDSGTDTGLYSPGTDQVAISTGGTARLTVDASGNVNIDSNTLYVDAANNRVGVGITPTVTLDVNGVSYFRDWIATGAASSSKGITSDSTSRSLLFAINQEEKARVDTSGRLLVGTSSAVSTINFASADRTPRFQVYGSDADQGSMALIRTAGYGIFYHAAGVSGTNVVSGTTLGSTIYTGWHTNKYWTGAEIRCDVDGAPDGNDMPSRLVFSTSADASSSPTERMRIGQSGYLKAANNGSYFNTTGSYHEFSSNVGDWVLFTRNTHSSPYGIIVGHTTDVNGTGNEFIGCYSGAAFGTTRFAVRSNGGIANYSANNVNLSDINAKKDIASAAGTWDCLKEWEIVNFRYKDQPDDADLSMGVIAQQVAESCPEVITVFQEAKEAKEAVLDEEGNELEPAQEAQPEKLGVKDQQMMWMAIKALQEAQLRIEELEAKVAALEAA